jgi:hypothetical protein
MNNPLVVTHEVSCTQSPSEVVDAARAYFAPYSYIEQPVDNSQPLVFEKKKRGLGFNPLDWASTVTIAATSNAGATAVSITATIDTTGQTVFEKETLKWREFIANFGRTLSGEALVDLGAVQKQANKQVAQFLLRALPYAIALGLVIGLAKAGAVLLFR